ncbi:hypothetical protein RHSIM_Rhsim02G0147700 [Rhododendron simsii]|uniref:Uncharacterized protein n=1 Tax=Rhododendron simsii TaxID=118357 RepID=A0A834HCY8_RHOSS|nr:hypothetical protein RHSIM_Rhsim02G0147700 [Rhododendron simsii]
MVRKKGMGKNIATSSRQEIVKESEDDFMVEDSDEDSVPLESRTGKREKRRKRRTPKKMEVDAKLDWKLDISDVLTSGKIKSKVNGKTIVVDVPAIAKVPPYKPGRFRDTYRVLNQVVITICIPEELRISHQERVRRQKGISKGVYEKLEEPSPRIITKAVLVKSKSQSKVSTTGTSAGQSASIPSEPSLWTVPDSRASQESIWRKLCCQNIAIWNCLNKEKKEREKLGSLSMSCIGIHSTLRVLRMRSARHPRWLRRQRVRRRFCLDRALLLVGSEEDV